MKFYSPSLNILTQNESIHLNNIEHNSLSFMIGVKTKITKRSYICGWILVC